MAHFDRTVEAARLLDEAHKRLAEALVLDIPRRIGEERGGAGRVDALLRTAGQEISNAGYGRFKLSELREHRDTGLWVQAQPRRARQAS